MRLVLDASALYEEPSLLPRLHLAPLLVQVPLHRLQTSHRRERSNVKAELQRRDTEWLGVWMQLRVESM